MQISCRLPDRCQGGVCRYPAGCLTSDREGYADILQVAWPVSGRGMQISCRLPNQWQGGVCRYPAGCLTSDREGYADILQVAWPVSGRGMQISCRLPNRCQGGVCRYPAGCRTGVTLENAIWKQVWQIPTYHIFPSGWLHRWPSWWNIPQAEYLQPPPLYPVGVWPARQIDGFLKYEWY